MTREPDRLEDALAEIKRLKTERKNCPPASDSEYVRRLEDEVVQLRTEVERLRRELGIERRLIAIERKP